MNRSFPVAALNPAFSLIEVLIAIMILGIGVISIASLFPAGIAQQRQTNDEVMGALVAGNALAIIRSKVSAEDFGMFEEFGYPNPFSELQPGFIAMSGDWPWIRPGFILEDDGNTAFDDRGAVDIFSSRYMRAETNAGVPAPNLPNAEDNPPPLLYATEFPNGNYHPLYGLPFSRAKWGNPGASSLIATVVPPEFIITQAERYYPMQSQVATNADGDAIAPSRPHFVWDCMFRRFNGQILVAIFVYRVTPEGGMETYRYAVPARIDSDPLVRATSPMPDRLDMYDAANEAVTGGTSPPAWDGNWSAYDPRYLNDGSPDNDSPEASRFVAGNEAGRDYNSFNRAEFESYQHPGQWLLDQNNAIHRIVSQEVDEDSGVLKLELRRNVSPVPTREYLSQDQNGDPIKLLTTPYFYRDNYGPTTPYQDPDQIPNTGDERNEVYHDIVTHLWFVPMQVGIDENDDGDEELNVSLTPVYVLVREL